MLTFGGPCPCLQGMNSVPNQRVQGGLNFSFFLEALLLRLTISKKRIFEPIQNKAINVQCSMFCKDAFACKIFAKKLGLKFNH
jgi:hypothetical protein